MEIVVGILAFIYRSDIEKVVGNELLKGIKERYPKQDSDKDHDNLKAGWKFIQENVSSLKTIINCKLCQLVCCLRRLRFSEL